MERANARTTLTMHQYIASEFLNYFREFSENDILGFEHLSPDSYFKFISYTMSLFRLVEKELKTLDIDDEKKTVLEVFIKYKNKQYLEPYEKYYKWFVVKKTTEGDFEYDLIDYGESPAETLRSKVVYKTLIPNPYCIRIVGDLLVEGAKKIGIIGFIKSISPSLFNR